MVNYNFAPKLPLGNSGKIMGQYLTYLSGITAILGFTIQVRDIPPEHRESRKTISLLSFGFFLGSSLRSISSFDIKIRTKFHPLALILLITLIIIVICLFFVFFKTINSIDHQKRNKFHDVLMGGILFFFVLLVATGIAFGILSSQGNTGSLSNRERMPFSTHNLKRRNYENAIKYFENSMSGYSTSDLRRK